MRERDIFDAALAIGDPAQRSAYLAEASAGNPELRRHLEELLDMHSHLGNFLEVPAAPLAATVDAQPAEEPGTVIGPYKLLQQIGEGGFGVVFMAEQTRPVRRKVALKILKPGMDTRQVIARFKAERQALALMDHPNIARVFDGGATEAGRPYFVMELVKGVPITEFCDQNQLTPRQRLEQFIPVCQAVQHAHQKGIIHRDLKPTNVIVSRHDTTPVPKVIDFGVAKALGQELTDKTLFTGIAQMIGTPLYMSPEQAGMSDLDVDTRSDIYSLGVLLYELLTGTTPFTKERFGQANYDDIRRIIREEEPPRPSTRLLESRDTLESISAQRQTDPAKLTKLVRGELDWIVMKALEKDRNRRYETANALARDVQRYLANKPVQAGRPSAGYRLRKFVRRNRGPVLAAALVLLALVGGVIGTTLAMIRATDAQAEAVFEAKQKEAALTDAQDKLWLSFYERARAERFSRRRGQRLDSLAALAEAARLRPDERLRDEAIAAMALPDVHGTPAWHSSRPRGTTTAAYGGHYRLFARADAQGVISIHSIADGQEVRRIVSGPITFGDNLYFSFDERFLLGFGEGQALRVWRVADGQSVLRDEPRGCNSPTFSPDGQRLAVSQGEWILCFDLATGQEVKRWRSPMKIHDLAYNPDNSQLAVGYYSPRDISVFDATSGNLVADLPVGAIGRQRIAWHPDGERLVVGGTDPRIQIWNVPAKRKVATLEGHAQDVAELTCHPEGGLLASYSWDGTLRLWDPSTGRPLLQLPLQVSDRPRFSGDGHWLATALHGEEAQLLEVTPSREYRTLVSSEGAGQGTYGRGDISPDGRLLIVGIEEGARLWDLQSGRELIALPPQTVHVAFEGGEYAMEAPGRPRALLTCGKDGLLRWPLIWDDPESGHLRLDQPKQLSTLYRARYARTPEGRTLVAVTEEFGGANQILDLDTGAVRRNLGPHPLGDVGALSRDGRWAASCGWHSDRVWLWNVDSGEMVHEWALGKRAFVYFTPDSRALVISRDDEFSFWDVATFQPILRLTRDVAQFPGHVAFSPDGKLMAVEMAPAIIHLKEVATGRTVARLEDPHGDRAVWQEFTPDGAQLVVVARYAHAIHIWDLRAIRARLKEMNLDWDWPEIAPAGEGPRRSADPLKVSGISEDRFWLFWRSQARSDANAKRWDEAVAHFTKALDLNPNDAQSWYERGNAHRWLDQWSKAFVDHGKAVELKPDDPWYRTCQGFDCAQLGQWDKAAAAFEHATNMKPDCPVAGYYLALLELQRRDRAGYRKVCSRMIERFGDSHWTTWTIALAPEAVADWTKPLQVAEKAYVTDNKNFDKIIHSGAVLYRAGRFKEAVERLSAADDAYKQSPSRQNPITYNWLFQAMAHHQLGHAKEASNWLEKAVQAIDEPSPEAAQDPATKTWNRRLTLQRLRSEVDELLGKNLQ
jgi:serine/threonine protein kinase/WD40 repeat protein